jgi:hypothetical protein
MGFGDQSWFLFQLPIQLVSVPHMIEEFSMTSQKSRFNNGWGYLKSAVYQTRPSTVTGLKLMHTEQEVACISLETTRRHIISIKLSPL